MRVPARDPLMVSICLLPRIDLLLACCGVGRAWMRVTTKIFVTRQTLFGNTSSTSLLCTTLYLFRLMSDACHSNCWRALAEVCQVKEDRVGNSSYFKNFFFCQHCGFRNNTINIQCVPRLHYLLSFKAALSRPFVDLVLCPPP